MSRPLLRARAGRQGRRPTRIVGSLGIHTTMDFANRKVVECHTPGRQGSGNGTWERPAQVSPERPPAVQARSLRRPDPPGRVFGPLNEAELERQTRRALVADGLVVALTDGAVRLSAGLQAELKRPQWEQEDREGGAGGRPDPVAGTPGAAGEWGRGHALPRGAALCASTGESCRELGG
jgi:hypothetical protein